MNSAYVRSLFDSIAGRYDLLNHLLSGGVDVYWRRKAISLLKDVRPRSVLDVACGTADFSLAACSLGPEEVVGVDIAENMLAVGRRKIEEKGFGRVVTLRRGGAEDLPFNSASFDAAIVAFGVRNFEDLGKGLAEMYRVVRPGGRIIVLEFSRPRRFPFKQIYMLYFRNLLPTIGRLVSGHPEAYRYLRDSVMLFPEGADFLARLAEAGFRGLRENRLTFGIATIYSGIR